MLNRVLALHMLWIKTVSKPKMFKIIYYQRVLLVRPLFGQEDAWMTREVALLLHCLMVLLVQKLRDALIAMLSLQGLIVYEHATGVVAWGAYDASLVSGASHVYSDMLKEK